MFIFLRHLCSASIVDNKNKTAFFEKLDFYRSHLKAARRVAVEGYLHAMEHHRAANLIDYVLRVCVLRNFIPLLPSFQLFTHASECVL